MRADGKYLYCDGEECQAKALAPVALRSFLSEGSEPLSTKGWLFVSENGSTCHFCPRCAPRYINALTSREHNSEGIEKESLAHEQAVR